MSKDTKETELYFYGRVTNTDGFEQAVSQEIHEQYEYRPGGYGSSKVRIRATTIDGKVTYTETIKVPTKKDDTAQICTEATVEITEDYFEACKKLYAVTGVKKIRYVFLSKKVSLNTNGEAVLLPEVKYEVDVLLDKQGNRSKWCKIDIEIDSVLNFLKENHPDVKDFDATVSLKSLPIGLEDVFNASSPTEEQKEALTAFYEKFSHSTNDSSSASTEDAVKETKEGDKEEKTEEVATGDE